MPGTPLQKFNDFMEGTGPVYLTGPTSIMNEAVSQSYLFRHFMQGRDFEKELIGGGAEIKEKFMFDERNTARNVLPNESLTYTQPQVLDDISIAYRYTVDYMSWTAQEISLNEGASRQQIATKFVNLKTKLEQRLATSIVKFKEDNLLRVPVGSVYGPAQMEDKEGREPYSIFAFVNEETNGLYTGWTRKETLDPAANEKWRPVQKTYESSQILNDSTNGLLRAFDDLAEDVEFVPPTDGGGVLDGNWMPNDPRRQVVITSRTGKNNYRQALRANNDSFISKQDPAYNSPEYNGVKVVKISKLDSVQAWDDGTASETTASIAFPRYLWLNGNYIKPIYHPEKYFERDVPMRHISQPLTWVQHVHCWWNLICTSVRRQGVISPVTS